MTDTLDPLRTQLVRALDWEEAHAGFDKAVGGLSPDKRGARAEGFDHSAWQLLEHMRLAQQDLLDFCANAQYSHTMTWPDDYWPASPAPSTAEDWEASIAGFHSDREQLRELVKDDGIDLFSLVPTGTGQQTYLRTIMLVIDHNAYHVGQLVALRRALGVWP